MAINFSETPQERETREALKRKKRVVILTSIVGVLLLVRFLVDDPAPPPPPDYSNTPIRYLPGMLAAMDPETRLKLTPEQIAKFEEADRLAAEGRWKGKLAAKEKEVYVPQEAVEEIKEDVEAYREELFVYELKRKRIEEKKREMLLASEIVKGTLVLFRNGSHTKVRSAEKGGQVALLNYDRGVKLTLPSKTVRRIVKDAEEWQAPVPKGFVKLTPVKGATLILKKQTAKRVTYEKNYPYEDYL